MKNYYLKLLLITVLLTFSKQLLGQTAPTITNFSPQTGKPGDIVTLTGTNFNTTAANNIVFFGATRATVTTATNTSVTVAVPTGATYAPIVLLNTDISLTAYSTKQFTPTYSPVKTGITTTDFLPKQFFSTGETPRSVAIGDLDGDGKPDLAVVNYTSNTVSVYHNTANSGSIVLGSFATKVDFVTGSSPQSIAIGDLDGDGKTDLAVVNSSSNTISIFRNTATSGSIASTSFAPKIDFVTGSMSWSVAIGDLDGDGKPDLAVTNISSDSVSVLRNTTTSGNINSSSFTAKVDFATGDAPYSVAISDLDEDGKADLAVANWSSNTVSVLRNTTSSGSIGSNSFANKVDFATGNGPRFVGIGDLDGDGKADLAVANSSSNTVSIFRNTASSGSIVSTSFAAKIDFATGSSPWSVAIGDLDGNGKADLAVANRGSKSVSVLRNTAISGSIGSASFATKIDFLTESLPSSVAIGDLDGNGKPDLVETDVLGVSVLRNAEPIPTITNFSPQTGKPGDLVTITGTNFNTTATNNIVFFGATKAIVTAATATSVTVTVPTGATYAYITLLNTETSVGACSKKQFTPTYSPAKNNIMTTDFLPKQDFVTGPRPVFAAIGDLDGDSKPDLVVVNQISSSVSVYRNTSSSGSIGSSSFAGKVDFAIGSDLSPYSLAIGDLDGDGKADLVVANYAGVSVLRNIASSGSIDSNSFATSLNFRTGGSTRSVAIGDLDGDGKADLAVTNVLSNTVLVLRNTSSRGSINLTSFDTRYVTFATGDEPQSIAIGDLDGDGKADLAVANFNSNTISVLRNTASIGSIGSASFAAKVDFTTGSNPSSLAIGDLDGDGKVDLVVTNWGGAKSVSVLLNTASSGSIGSASFAAKVDFTTGSSPRSVAIGDLDGDGKADLAVANFSSDNVSVFRNMSSSGSFGSGSFAPKVDFATRSNSFPNSVAIGDLDGDGKADLAVANFDSNTISLFRNADVTTLNNDSFTNTSFKLYPNPATNNINIDIAELTNTKLQVLDFTGKVLLNQTLDNTTNSVDISQLPNGIYLFKTTATEGTIISKVVKN